jgi:K+-transporting ATPase KdpF subunit
MLDVAFVALGCVVLALMGLYLLYTLIHPEKF